MAFDRYPAVPAPPLSVPPSTASAWMDFTELASAGPPPTTHIYLVMLATVVPLGAAARPTLRLRARTNGAGVWGTGVAVPYPPPAPDPHVPVTVIDEGGVEAGSARIFELGSNLYRTEILLPNPGTHEWQLQIENNDATFDADVPPDGIADPREFTWVVGDSQAEAQQPWLHVEPATVTFDVLINQTPATTAQSVAVHNKGTGPLTVTAVNPAIGPDFAVTLPAGPVAPNSSLDLAFTFNPPGSPGTANATGNLEIGPETDSDAGTAAHNNQVSLQATARALELALLLDDSGSMDFAPDGTFLPDNDPNARWAHLEDAVEQFLLQLVIFGENKGTFGITGFNAANASTNIVAPATIGGPGSMAGAIAAVNAVNANGGTPMGAGLNWVLNPGTGYLVDPTNNRWLLVFSDGAHNSGVSPYDFISAANGGTAGQSLDQRNIEIFAVGYGEEGAADVQFSTLEDLAADSEDGGHTRQVTPSVGSDLSPILVAQAIRDAIKTDMIPDLASASDPGGQINGSGDEARHLVVITPYDSKAAFSLTWNTAAAGRLHLQLLTPTCELLTPDLVQSSSGPAGITFSGSDRFQLFAIPDDYLRNSDDPARPRYGTWQVIVTGGNMDEGETESYTYDVSVESRLLLKTEFARASHFAGESIEFLAHLTLDGKPIRDATVIVEVESPGQSADNWLASVAINADEFQQARDTLAEIGLLEDSSAFDVKAFAARQKNLVFKRFPRKQTIPMSYSEPKRAYTASFSSTTTPGTYDFYVTATGVTEDGVEFRREKGAQAAVRVRPEPECTLFNTTYRRVENALLADVRFTLCDRFGNAVLVDPTRDRVFAVRVDGGQVLKGISNNLDGTYSTSVRYEAEAEPRVSVRLGDATVLRPQRLVPMANLDWATEILDFQAGVEGKPGANQFAEPRALLEDPTSKPPDRFLALGGGGQVIVGTGGQPIAAQGTEDVTVVVRPGAARHSYAVEALAPDGERWVLLGESGGETSSFGLRQAGLKETKAIRIRDTSRAVRGVDFEPLAAPGAQVQGVGFRRREERPPTRGFPLDCLEGVDKKTGRMLLQAGINTIRELAGADPDRLHVDIPRLALLELIAEARAAELVMRQLAGLEFARSIDLTVGELLTAEEIWLMRRTGLDPRQLAALRQLLMSLVIVMNNACVEQVPLQKLLEGWR